MNKLSNMDVINWLKRLAKTYEAKKTYLTELDREIGDADHGYNMARGFTEVEKKIELFTDNDIGTILKTVAMTLISTVGGASGPLYGSFFLKASLVANGKNELTVPELGALLEVGLQSVISRGKASVGDKTMIDAMQPAVKAYEEAEGESLEKALEKAWQAACAGAESTIPLIAKKGRASYLGERSVGHLDPGAASTALLFEDLYKAVST